MFNLILERAVKAKLPPSDMVKTLFIFSDMEFDKAVAQPGVRYGHGHGYGFGCYTHYGGYGASHGAGRGSGNGDSASSNSGSSSVTSESGSQAEGSYGEHAVSSDAESDDKGAEEMDAGKAISDQLAGSADGGGRGAGSQNEDCCQLGQHGGAHAGQESVSMAAETTAGAGGRPMSSNHGHGASNTGGRHGGDVEVQDRQEAGAAGAEDGADSSAGHSGEGAVERGSLMDSKEEPLDDPDAADDIAASGPSTPPPLTTAQATISSGLPSIHQPHSSPPAAGHLSACPPTSSPPPSGPTNFQAAKAAFAAAGYELPNVVFWNLRASERGHRRGVASTPVTRHESGAALVSGFSGQLLKLFMGDELFKNRDTFTPMYLMETSLARYDGWVVVD